MSEKILNIGTNSSTIVYTISEEINGYYDPMDENNTQETLETVCIDPGDDGADALEDSLSTLDIPYYEWGRFRIFQIIPYIDRENNLEDRVIHRQNAVINSKAERQLLKMYKYL